jgi:hypothetical protein
VRLFRFWKNNEIKRVPESVLQYMKRRFLLPTLYISSLRCFEHEGIFHGEPVMQIHIFDPYLAGTLGLAIGKRSDLDMHPEVLQFEGYIDQKGHIYIADRRSPIQRKHNSDAVSGGCNRGNGDESTKVLPKTKLASYGPGAGWPPIHTIDEDWE